MNWNQSKQLRIKAAEAQGWSGPWRFGSIHLHGTPPGAEKPATGWTDDEHVPQGVDDIVKELCYQVSELSDGIESVRSLIDDSAGVAGLHKNGDIAPWGELQDDGWFYEWLFQFNAAEDVVKKNLGEYPELVHRTDGEVG